MVILLSGQFFSYIFHGQWVNALPGVGLSGFFHQYLWSKVSSECVPHERRVSGKIGRFSVNGIDGVLRLAHSKDMLGALVPFSSSCENYPFLALPYCVFSLHCLDGGEFDTVVGQHV
jgi:hypothetical protein